MESRTKRLNALARKARTPGGLSETERAEQEALRRAYLEDFRSGLAAQLEHTYIQEADGSLHKLRRRDETV